MMYKDEVERIRREEIRLKLELAGLKDEFKQKADEYYKEQCGSRYKEIYDLLTDYREYGYLNKSVYKQNNYIMNSIRKSLDKLVSNKVKTVIPHVPSYSKNTYVVALNYTGIGYCNSYYKRVQRIDELDTLVNVFKKADSLGIKLSKYVWKKSKKEMLDEYQKQFHKFITTLPDNIEIKKNVRVEIKAEESVAGFKFVNSDIICISMNDYYDGIKLGSSYSSERLFRLQNDNLVTPYDCYLINQIYDIIKDDFTNLVNQLKLMYENNLKVYKEIIDNVGHLMVAENL